MAIEIKDKVKCTGCFACQNICPANCISMKEDECGFKYPFVDNGKCINCHQCEKVCPVMGKKVPTYKTHGVYAAWSKDAVTRYESTSGGIFSELAYNVIKGGGGVVGAAYEENNTIEHIFVDKTNNVHKVRQSKYAQSDINGIYRKIQALSKDRKILFCGTPCQVAGLRNYLQVANDNIITVDFICRGVNSPKAFREWLRELETNHNSQIRKVWFKYKVDGWHSSPKCTRVQFNDGTDEIYKGKNNSFMYGYLGPNLYIRPSCGECAFKGENRVSDITLGDFWGIDESIDDNKGASLVIINTEQGRTLFQSIFESIVTNKCELRDIFEGNVCFDNCVKINKKSEEFLSQLGTASFSTLVSRYSRKSVLDWFAILKKWLIKKLEKGLS